MPCFHVGRWRLSAALGMLVFLGCPSQRDQTPPAEPSRETVPRSPERPSITTDRERYQLEHTANALEATIVATFTNHTADTVYLHPCGRVQPAFVLEKWIGGEWRPAYNPPCPAILMLEVPSFAPGKSRTDTARVNGSLSPNAAPRFEVEPVAGTYRIVYAQAYGSWRRGEGPGELLPLDRRASGAFQIVE